MSTKRDALRTAALKTRAPKSKIVEFEGIAYEVRAPTVETRGKILERAGVLDDDAAKKAKGSKAKHDAAALQVAAVIACTFVPGEPGAEASSETVFEDADVARLLIEPAGGIVDVLGEVALAFLNTSMDKTAAKNA